jgi:hypothetical protein
MNTCPLEPIRSTDRRRALKAPREAGTGTKPRDFPRLRRPTPAILRLSADSETAFAIAAGEPRQKWRISPRVGMTNDASAANGRAPLAAPRLGVGCRYPRQTDAFSLSRRNSRATYTPAPAVFPARESQRASHRAAFGMPGRAGKARSVAVVGPHPPVSQGGRGPATPCGT